MSVFILVVYFSRSRDKTPFRAVKQPHLCNCPSSAFQISQTIDQHARKPAKLAKQVLLNLELLPWTCSGKEPI